MTSRVENRRAQGIDSEWASPVCATGHACESPRASNVSGKRRTLSGAMAEAREVVYKETLHDFGGMYAANSLPVAVFAVTSPSRYAS